MARRCVFAGRPTEDETPTAGFAEAEALLGVTWIFAIPEGPSTQYYLRFLVPKMVFGTRVLQYWVLGPSGSAVVFWVCDGFLVEIIIAEPFQEEPH